MPFGIRPLMPAVLAALVLTLPAAAQVTRQGKTGGWEISQQVRGGKFYRCIAATTGAGNTGLDINAMADASHLLSLRNDGPKPHTADTATLQLKPSGQSFTLPMEQHPGDRLWTAGPLTADFLTALGKAQELDVTVKSSGAQHAYRLGDPGQMLTALDGCAGANKGH